MSEKAILDSQAVSRALKRICYEIIERNRGAGGLCFVGVLRRGAALAQRMADIIAQNEGAHPPVGKLDIGKFRDDGRAAHHDNTDIPFDVENAHVILVDDVLYTGRTARAALDALLSRGRPKTVQLAVLIDRGHRELPIRPDYVGKNLPTSSSEVVRVRVEEYDGQTGVTIERAANAD